MKTKMTITEALADVKSDVTNSPNDLLCKCGHRERQHDLDGPSGIRTRCEEWGQEIRCTCKMFRYARATAYTHNRPIDADAAMIAAQGLLDAATPPDPRAEPDKLSLAVPTQSDKLSLASSDIRERESLVLALGEADYQFGRHRESCEIEAHNRSVSFLGVCVECATLSTDKARANAALRAFDAAPSGKPV